MTIKAKIQTASRRMVVSCLAGAAVFGFAQMAQGYMTSNNSSVGEETCTFTQQLQSSSLARQQYLAKVIEVIRDTPNEEPTGLEDMYASAQQTSFWADDVTFDLPYKAPATKRQTSILGIDSFSAECINCHDGVSASSVKVQLRNSPLSRGSHIDSFNTDHPMGMDYNMYVSASRGYKSITTGSNKMLFVDGRVGCLTCHDPLNPEKGHLVMSDRQSALCLTCHNM